MDQFFLCCYVRFDGKDVEKLLLMFSVFPAAVLLEEQLPEESVGESIKHSNDI